MKIVFALTSVQQDSKITVKQQVMCWHSSCTGQDRKALQWVIKLSRTTLVSSTEHQWHQCSICCCTTRLWSSSYDLKFLFYAYFAYLLEKRFTCFNVQKTHYIFHTVQCCCTSIHHLSECCISTCLFNVPSGSTKFALIGQLL